jgi:hypothetical protein
VDRRCRGDEIAMLHDLYVLDGTAIAHVAEALTVTV